MKRSKRGAVVVGMADGRVVVQVGMLVQGMLMGEGTWGRVLEVCDNGCWIALIKDPDNSTDPANSDEIAGVPWRDLTVAAAAPGKGCRPTAVG